jgi:hypothetical protein
MIEPQRSNSIIVFYQPTCIRGVFENHGDEAMSQEQHVALSEGYHGPKDRSAPTKE